MAVVDTKTLVGGCFHKFVSQFPADSNFCWPLPNVDRHRYRVSRCWESEEREIRPVQSLSPKPVPHVNVSIGSTVFATKPLTPTDASWFGPTWVRLLPCSPDGRWT